MANKRWTDLRPQVRRLILIAGTVEATLKVAALIDLARRPSREVRGSKARWATAIVVINAGGLVPVVYFARGRRRR
jgi:hypothetical protein